MHNLARNWEGHAQQIYTEATNRITGDIELNNRLESQLQAFAHEMQSAKRVVDGESQAYHAFLKLQEQLPLAQSEYATMQRQRDLARADSFSQQNALERERGTVRDLKLRLQEFEAKNTLISKTSRELSVSQSETAHVRAEHASAQALAAEYNRRVEFGLEKIKDLEVTVEELRSESRMLALENNTAEPSVAPTLQLRGTGGACASDPAPSLPEGTIPPAVQAKIDRQEREIQQLKATVAEWCDPDNYHQDHKDATPSTPAPSKAKEPTSAIKNVRTLSPSADANAGGKVSLQTTLTVAAKVGDSILEVHSTRGMKVGQRIKIGTKCYEESVIQAFGSIHLTGQLSMDHEVGAAVVVIDNTTNIPVIRLDADDDDDEPSVQGTGNNSDSSGIDVKIGTRSKPKVGPIPTFRHEVRAWHLDLVEQVLATSSRQDDKERLYLDLAHQVTSLTDERLDVVHKRYLRLDRVLRPELVKACKADTRLTLQIQAERFKLSMMDPPKIITSTRILAMIYFRLSTDTNLLEVCQIHHLTGVRWEDFGDNNANQFYYNFMTVRSRMATQLSENHLRDLLYYQMSFSEGLKLPLLDYDKLPADQKTYEAVQDVLEQWMTKTQNKANLQAEMKSDGGLLSRPIKSKKSAANKGGKAAGKGSDGKIECFQCGQNHMKRDCPNLPKEEREKLQQQASARGDGTKGGSSSRATSKGGDGTKGGSSSRATSKGAGKGTGRGPLTDAEKAKIKCAYYQTDWHNGKGCSNGDNCKFAHDKCKDQAEWDALYKPWKKSSGSPRQHNGGTPRENTTPRGSPRDKEKKGGGKGQGKMLPNMGLYCKKYLECPGRHEKQGGDGTCYKMHADKAVADANISNWKNWKKEHEPKQ